MHAPVMANQVHTITYKDRQIEAYIYKNKYSFYDGVYTDGVALYHMSLQDPKDPECNVASKVQIGINFDSVSQLDTLLSSSQGHQLERDIRLQLDKLIAHWIQHGYETEWCASRSHYKLTELL